MSYTNIQWWRDLDENWKKQLIKNVKGLRIKFSEDKIEEHLREILSLKALDLDEAYPVQSFGPLEKLSQLERLEIRKLPHLTQIIKSIPLLRQLKSLTISNMDLGELSFLNRMENLEELDISSDFPQEEENWFDDISPLKTVKNLKSLHIEGGELSSEKVLTDLSPIEELVDLESVMLENADVDNLKSFRNLKSLTSLRLQNFSASSLDGIEELTQLETLELVDFDRLRNIDAISNIELKELELSDCSKISDLDKIQPITSLKRLSFDGEFDFKNLSFLSGMENLTSLYFGYTTQLKDISPLKNLKTLEYLTIGQSKPKYNGIEILLDLPNLKDVRLRKQGLKNAGEILKTIRRDRPEVKIMVN